MLARLSTYFLLITHSTTRTSMDLVFPLLFTLVAHSRDPSGEVVHVLPTQGAWSTERDIWKKKT